MDGVVVEQKKAEHVRGDCVDAAVLERQLGFVNICFILTPVFVPCFLINIKKVNRVRPLGTRYSFGSKI